MDENTDTAPGNTAQPPNGPAGSTPRADGSSQASSKPRRRPPRVIIIAGCRANSVEEVAEGLQLASQSPNFSSGTYHSLLALGISHAIANDSIPVLRYLLSEKKAPVDSLDPLFVSTNPSIEVLSLLVSHGWDVNYRSPDRGAGRGQRLLDLICRHGESVRWCFEHGASVEEDPKADWYMSPPLLETAARAGSLETFKLLQERGAKMGERTLHQSVGSASTSSGEDVRVRMEVVKYLVEELGMSVNQMDAKEKLPDRWGTPLCYAAKGSPQDGGEVVTRYLLEKGADPYIKDIYGNHNAFTLAEKRNKIVAKVLGEWKEKTGRKDEASDA